MKKFPLIVAIMLLLTAAPRPYLSLGAGQSRDSYGAIAYSKTTGAWGTSYDSPTGRQAESFARQQCGRRDCELLTVIRNACAALAESVPLRGGNRPYGWASADTRREAEIKARTICYDSGGRRCQTLCWVCTSR